MKLYYHPLSSYSQKVVMRSTRRARPSSLHREPHGSPAEGDYKKIQPLGKLPLLVDEKLRGFRVLDHHRVHRPPLRGHKLIRTTPISRGRCGSNRFFDLYVNDTMSRSSSTACARGQRDRSASPSQETSTPRSARSTGHGHHTWRWATPSRCRLRRSAGPGYCRMVHPFGAFENVTAYFGRLQERPSFRRS